MIEKKSKERLKNEISKYNVSAFFKDLGFSPITPIPLGKKPRIETSEYHLHKNSRSF